MQAGGDWEAEGMEEATEEEAGAAEDAEAQLMEAPCKCMRSMSSDCTRCPPKTCPAQAM